MKPRLVFMGTPEFAVPSLRVLLDNPDFEVIALITQPDRPAGRGLKLQPPPVKEIALERSLPVFQPATLRGITFEREAVEKPVLRTTRAENEELVQFLLQQPPIDAFIVVAYGNIIPSALIDFPLYGAINVHASLLPRWRGAAPIQAAIFHGDKKTGVCLMAVDAGLDQGPVYCCAEHPLNGQETSGELHDALSITGAKLLNDKLAGIISGSIGSVPQTEEGATYAEKWEAEDCAIDWSEGAEKTLRRIRASSPAPGARTKLNGSIIKVFAARPLPADSLNNEPPGTVVEVTPAEIIVVAGPSERVAISELQLAGKKKLPAADIIRGRAIREGDVFEAI